MSTAIKDGLGSGYLAQVTDKHQVIPAGVDYKIKSNKCDETGEYFEYKSIKLESWLVKELREIVKTEVRAAITSLLKVE